MHVFHIIGIIFWLVFAGTLGFIAWAWLRMLLGSSADGFRDRDGQNRKKARDSGLTNAEGAITGHSATFGVSGGETATSLETFGSESSGFESYGETSGGEIGGGDFSGGGGDSGGGGASGGW
jgi:uncharacterized membrane protein YgcG